MSYHPDRFFPYRCDRCGEYFQAVHMRCRAPSERPMMSREELERGFAQGRTVTQEEWANPREIAAIDGLIANGKAKIITPWQYLDTFQCERRRIRGVRT